MLYSAYSSEIPLYVEFDKLVKKNLGIKSVIGGPGPTFDWKIIKNNNSTIDALCVGEGNTLWLILSRMVFRLQRILSLIKAACLQPITVLLIWKKFLFGQGLGV